MVTLHRGSRWKVAIYGREHGVPHFHIEGPDFRCSVNIDDLEVIIGNVPTDVLKEVRVWARRHQKDLKARWHALNS